MKRIIFLIIIAALLTGCANDQYAIEKRYWKIQKEAEKIFKNPHASPPLELQRVVNLLENFIKQYPNSNLGLEADFNIARLYIVKEEYAKGRVQLTAIKNKYHNSDAISAEAAFLIGNSYQIENKWGLALEQYKKIMQEYPATLRGIDIPVYIAQYYKAKYQPDKMIGALQEAIAHYNGLADKFPNSPLAFQAGALVADCYRELKDWQGAINTYNALIDKYKNKASTDGLLMNIAIIYQKEMKDNTKAKDTLNRLIKEYPKSRLIKVATALLKQMEKK